MVLLFSCTLTGHLPRGGSGRPRGWGPGCFEQTPSKQLAEKTGVNGRQPFPNHKAQTLENQPVSVAWREREKTGVEALGSETRIRTWISSSKGCRPTIRRSRIWRRTGRAGSPPAGRRNGNTRRLPCQRGSRGRPRVRLWLAPERCAPPLLTAAQAANAGFLRLRSCFLGIKIVLDNRPVASPKLPRHRTTS